MITERHVAANSSLELPFELPDCLKLRRTRRIEAPTSHATQPVLLRLSVDLSVRSAVCGGRTNSTVIMQRKYTQPRTAKAQFLSAMVCRLALQAYLVFICAFGFYMFIRVSKTLGLGGYLWYGCFVLAVEVLGATTTLIYGAPRPHTPPRPRLTASLPLPRQPSCPGRPLHAAKCA